MKRLEEQPKEVHLEDFVRLHAKHKEQEEQEKTEATNGDASISLEDVLPSNISSSKRRECKKQKDKVLQLHRKPIMLSM